MGVRVLIILAVATSCACASRGLAYATYGAGWGVLSALSSSYGAELAQCRATGNTRERCGEDHGNIEGRE